MENYDELEEFMNYLEEDGVLEWVGMDESGERTFIFNFEKLYDVFPELYEAMIQELDKELMHLYQLGFVEIEYDQNLNARFKITDDGRQYLMDNGIPIPEEWDE